MTRRTLTRGYSAALSQGIILDTEDPANPSVLTSFLDPAINVWHQSDPVTIGDREFLLAKTPRIEDDGSFHMFGNDIARGFDVYRFTGAQDSSVPAGTMMTPTQAAVRLGALKRPKLSAANPLFCMLPAQQ